MQKNLPRPGGGLGGSWRVREERFVELLKVFCLYFVCIRNGRLGAHAAPNEKPSVESRGLRSTSGDRRSLRPTGTHSCMVNRVTTLCGLQCFLQFHRVKDADLQLGEIPISKISVALKDLRSWLDLYSRIDRLSGILETDVLRSDAQVVKAEVVAFFSKLSKETKKFALVRIKVLAKSRLEELEALQSPSVAQQELKRELKSCLAQIANLH